MAVQYHSSILDDVIKQAELWVGCSVCTVEENEVTYSVKTLAHTCQGNLLFAKFKKKGTCWRPISNRPKYPNPLRYDVCWFFVEGFGCTQHGRKCTFARSPEEAFLWTFLKNHALDHNAFISMVRKSQQRADHRSVQSLTPSHSTNQATAKDRHDRKSQGSVANKGSYQDRLLKEYRESSNQTVEIMAENVDDVDLTHDEDLYVECLEVGTQIKWSFHIKTERLLSHVALLKNDKRGVFSLGLSTQGTVCTYAEGKSFAKSSLRYEVNVTFTCTSCHIGLCEQWLVFDFDTRPVLLKKIKVRVGAALSLLKTEEGVETIAPALERWHKGNRSIIPHPKMKRPEDLLEKYRLPETRVYTSSTVESPVMVRPYEYRDKMHGFLYTEERVETDIIRRLDFRGTITLSTCSATPYKEANVVTYPGELIGSLPFSHAATIGTPEGFLLKREVETVLVGLVSPEDQKPEKENIYEALIVQEFVSEAEIHLKLSRECCLVLRFRKGQRHEVEVQFQLNRLNFCEMHKAIDLLPDLNNVLPDFTKCCVPSHSTKYPCLNVKQQAAMEFILGDTDGQHGVAPLLIYGPFGTGKTFTLASAAKEVVCQLGGRVLICTHTNSSADIYVSRHFHQFVQNGCHEARPLRIKKTTGLNATDSITLKYCLVSRDGQLIRRSDLDSHRILITTTLWAKKLRNMNLPKDYFSHIMIDEASQMLECEALIALGLAGPATRVVLAGDHMQMGPKLFSVDDDTRSEHTLLNRLFYYYQSQEKEVASKSRIIFTENYRSNEEIVKFVSTHFYTGKSVTIRACGDVPRHPKHYPLNFHHVRGECRLHAKTQSCYNWEETECVVKIVKDLYDQWPVQEWGVEKKEAICILSEGRQIRLIRDALKSKRLDGEVLVQSVANIQGKQFRVIVMSTVQTTDHLLTSKCCLEFFNDARVLNTAMTRAQSQVIVVGDAAALCYFGKCSRTWRCYVERCIENGGAQPEYLTKEFLREEVEDISRFHRPECDVDAEEPPPPVAEDEVDPILQQMIREYTEENFEESDSEIETTFASQQHTRRCGQGGLFLQILSIGRCRSYIDPSDHTLSQASNSDLVGQSFVCFLEDDFQYKIQYKEKKFICKTMVPLRSEVKIRVKLQKPGNWLPIHQTDSEDTECSHVHINEQMKQKHVFVVEVICWKDNCPFPLGKVIGVLPIGASVEEDKKVLDAMFKPYQLPPDLIPHPTVVGQAIVDLRHVHTFTIDPQNAKRLDDAISIKDLDFHYEVGVHIADVVCTLGNDDALYRHETEEAQRSLSFDKVRNVISLITTVDKRTGQITNKTWQTSRIKSNSQLYYEEAEKILGERPTNDLRFETVNDCIAVAYQFAQACRKERLKARWAYSQPRDHQPAGTRKSYLMVEELSIMFNHEMSKYLLESTESKSCTPLRCQKSPEEEKVQKLKSRHQKSGLIHMSANLHSHFYPTLDQLPPYEFPHIEVDGRTIVNLRCLTTFTIDSMEAQHLEEAISIKELEEHYEVGVHFAANISVLENGDSLEKRRAVLCSPAREQQFLSDCRDCCSFTPGEDRIVISLITTVGKNSGLITKTRWQISKINLNRKLTYEAAENTLRKISGKDLRFETLEDCIAVAYHFSQICREEREMTSAPSENQTHRTGRTSCLKISRASLMVEELNIMFNKEMSNFNFNDMKTRSCENPEKEAAENLLETSATFKSHIFKPFKVLQSVWSEIQEAANNGKYDSMADLIGTDDLYPHFLPILTQFRHAQSKAYLIRSNSCDDAQVGHHSLAVGSYTWASSPLRREMDQVLQRLFHSVYSSIGVQYSTRDIDELCTLLEGDAQNTEEHDKLEESLNLSRNLTNSIMSMVACVVFVHENEDHFKVSFPFNKGSLPQTLPLLYRDLLLDNHPMFNGDDEHQFVRLDWRKRLYPYEEESEEDTEGEEEENEHEEDTEGKEEQNEHEEDTEGKEEQNEHEDTACIQVPQKLWHDIAVAVQHQDFIGAANLIKAIPKSEGGIHQKVVAGGGCEYVTKHCLCLRQGDVLNLQLRAERDRRCLDGLKVQLLYVNCDYAVCVEHARQPVECFTKLAEHYTKEYYKDINEYVKVWKPLCHMVSATTAVRDSESITIEDVPIQWRRNDPRKGSFSLPKHLIKKRKIECNLAQCYLCIKTEMKPNEMGDHQTFTWVAHGVVKGCEEEINKKKVKLHINHRSISIVQDGNSCFSVEIIPKLPPDIRTENAVNNIVKANDLVQNIALGWRLNNDNAVYKPKRTIILEKPSELPPLNESQYDAVSQAINSSFTIIQGPPGTGKTVVGAYIAYRFRKLLEPAVDEGDKKEVVMYCGPSHKSVDVVAVGDIERERRGDDEESDKKEVVMYCGPSHKSVDVVAEYLLKFEENLKPLRVYSRQTEIQEYPYPGSSLQMSRKSRVEKSRPQLRSITLHHRIREDGNPHSQDIKAFEERIGKMKLKNGKISKKDEEEIEKYKEKLNEARDYELKKHDIILCTCTAASSANLTKALSATFILIDECAMATEPQALIPLVSYDDPKKIVLLGDHKQLRPIVNNQKAKMMGMSRSMFERCISSNTYEKAVCTLNVQYRMHEDICEFPSHAYYGGKLQTKVECGRSALCIRRHGMLQPTRIVFVDIEGTETRQFISTEKGNERSVANEKECIKATKIAEELVQIGGIQQDDIVILSPYNAQVANIKTQLMELGLPKIAVNTITKSQGSEWRYVILSVVRSCPQKDIPDRPSREWNSRHIGFVGDANQINVAITRAQDGLCILGNQNLLDCSRAWRQLLQFYSERNCVVKENDVSVCKV